MLFKSKKLNDGHDHGEEEGVESEGPSDPKMILIPKDEDLRVIGLFGEVEENKVAQIIGMMLDMAETAEVEIDTEVVEGKEGEGEKKEPEVEVLPIEFLLSTPGGSADDMFALYDIMRVVKEKCPIVTFGIGKVMSAGVLLLAAGTKGQRKIGKNCRVMIHSVIGGTSGSFHNLENEMAEMRYMQEAYLKALSDESNMSVAQLKRMINRKVNVYLSAEEAVKMGIADIII
jgi:ATP-dependent Clp endopeptidase proteolytic subunit ClpP